MLMLMLQKSRRTWAFARHEGQKLKVHWMQIIFNIILSNIQFLANTKSSLEQNLPNLLNIFSSFQSEDLRDDLHDI